MQEFTKGAKVVSPYANAAHFANLHTEADPNRIGTVGDVGADGWAKVTYPDGYDILLNEERCLVLRQKRYNAFTGLTHQVGTVSAQRVLASEIVANFLVAANQAEREGLPAMAQLIRNDAERFQSCKKGTIIVLD